MVRPARVAGRKYPNVRGGDVPRVRDERPWAEEADRVEITGGRLVILLVRRLDLVDRFGEVRDQRNAQSIRERAARLQRRRVVRVHRMRRDRGRNQLVAGTLLRE